MAVNNQRGTFPYKLQEFPSNGHSLSEIIKCIPTFWQALLSLTYKIMKHTFVFAFLMVVAIGTVKANFSDDMKALFEACSANFPNFQGDIVKLFKIEMGMEPADDASKCYIKCIMEKEGTFVNGTFNMDEFIKIHKEHPVLKDHLDEVIERAKNCSALKGVNDCDAAYKIGTCLSHRH
uniref:Odorant binding protein n=2 Tax=Stomoxys calcitrans TaxID=35570 RepID=A0A1I8Q062_STOCA